VVAARWWRTWARFGKATLECAQTRRFTFNFDCFGSGGCGRCRVIAEPFYQLWIIALLDDGCWDLELALTFAGKSCACVCGCKSKLSEAVLVYSMAARKAAVDDTGGNEDGAHPAGIELVVVRLSA